MEEGKETLLGFTADIGRPDRPILGIQNHCPLWNICCASQPTATETTKTNPEQSERFWKSSKTRVFEEGGN